ncbi:MAG TPA: hypothetical protein VG938_11625 [Verrucomicrobiae bacterium]|jgi:hypothetical protein|nr:hypothetical protein [Verrucomicrobiae bacterium]
MRQLLLLAAMMSVFPLARAAAGETLATNTIPVDNHGTLEISCPTDWSLIRTNLNLPGKPVSVELHSLSNTVIVRLTIFWNGFGNEKVKPTEDDMEQSVSNLASRRYLPLSVEKTFTLEKLQGPAVTGPFIRFTDAGWTPVMTDEYQNVATGMFRSGNLWGNFDVLTNDKDGPNFKQGLKVVESIRGKP